MQELQANTGITVRVGPFVDATDGYNPETSLLLTGGGDPADDAVLLKHTGGTIDISARTWADITNANGWYDLTLTTSDTNTEGLLTIIIRNDSIHRPVYRDFMVLSQAAYASKYTAKDTGYMDVHTKTIEDSIIDADTLAADTITAAKVADAFLTAAKIGADAITNAKIADDAIAVENIKDAAITAAKIATDAITAAKIADAAIDAATFAAGAINAAAIATDAIDADAVAADVFTELSPHLMQSTTIATLASQTSFTLTAGSTDDDAYNGCIVRITDASTATQKAWGVISDYTGATKTVTLAADPLADFVMVATDIVDIVMPGNLGAINASIDAAKAMERAAARIGNKCIMTVTDEENWEIDVKDYAGTSSLWTMSFVVSGTTETRTVAAA